MWNLHLRNGNALGVFRAWIAGRARIAVRIHDARPLNTVRRTHRANRIHVPSHVSIVRWITVDEQTNRTVLFGLASLDPRLRTSVPRDRDFPLYRDPNPSELTLV